MSDIDKTNEMLRANGLPELKVVEPLMTGRFLMISPALAKEVSDEMDRRLRRQLQSAEYGAEELAEEVARTSHYTLHEARLLIMEFFNAGGSKELFAKVRELSAAQSVPLCDAISDVTRLKRIPAAAGSDSNS